MYRKQRIARDDVRLDAPDVVRGQRAVAAPLGARVDPRVFL